MEFLLLGPLEVRDDGGRELPLPRRMHRALLTMLLLHANEVISRDLLIEALWSGRPPPTAASALHVYVSQLRRIVGERLSTQAPGYRLRVEDRELDTSSFDALVAEARRAREPAERAQLLNAALSLWRGAPLVEFESEPFARSELARLVESRLGALEHRIDADLERGQGVELVPELEALVATEPYREHLRAQLMLALYRAGRQADALAAYRDGRELLVDTLGIDPGDELQQLERRILGQDPALAAATTDLAPVSPSRVELPRGTVTFVFTDIEGSTRLLGKLGAEGYAAELASHRTVLREAFTAHSGVEVDTQGDSFFYAFSRAGDALAAAADAQRMLEAGAVRVRIGIHSGEPILTEEGYVGLAVHHAARISAAAHGGQVLVSGATHELVPDELLRDLGEHELKDVPGRQRIWQLGDGTFPPLRSRRRTNLPRPAGPLIGRERELAEIQGLLREGTRLLTLTGVGGAGKTQLALHAAAGLKDHFDDGVFYVELGPLSEAALVRAAVAHALEHPEDELDRELAHRRLLLVLDNAEHLIGVELVVNGLLTGGAVVLVTSRAPLHLSAEHEYPVEPLLDAAAAALFVARAAAVGCPLLPDETVRAVCGRLDNLPLAVELAAARSKLLEPSELLRRLDRRFDLLTAGPRDAPDRQRTLRGMIDWSYELLSVDEQAVFVKLAVFAGGWSLEAGEQVCGCSVDLLGSLVDKNLVQRRAAGPATRFSMLETLREYARERLGGTDHETATRREHAGYFVGFAERAGGDLVEGSNQRTALGRLDPDLDNLRAALVWSHAAEPEWMLRLTAALGRFWTIRGLFTEARRWLELALDAGDLSSQAGVKALHQAGHLARLEGEHETARGYFERGLQVAEVVGPPQYVATFLMLLGQIDLLNGRWEPARRHLDKALVLQEAADDSSGTALTLVSLGAIAIETSDTDAAADFLARGAAGLRAAGDEISLAIVLPALAYVQLQRGLRDSAAKTWHDGLRLAVDLDAWPTAAWGLLVAALVEADREAVEATRWSAAAEAEYQRLGWAWEPIELRVRDEASTVLRSALGEPVWERERATGARDTLEDAVRRALAPHAPREEAQVVTLPT